MDKKLLIDLKTKGDEGSFDFEPHLPVYNPLLEFIKTNTKIRQTHSNDTKQRNFSFNYLAGTKSVKGDLQG